MRVLGKGGSDLLHAPVARTPSTGGFLYWVSLCNAPVLKAARDWEPPFSSRSRGALTNKSTRGRRVWATNEEAAENSRQVIMSKLFLIVPLPV